jgi:DNA-binding NarL/FixJ family response regulator
MSANLKDKIALVVDDSLETLAMLTDALSMEGMQVITAASGRAALMEVDKTRPDIILMDALMPGLDGFTTCKLLKAEKGLEDVPIIFMTGLNESESVVKALASGGVDFITKPVPFDQLFARMKVHLSNAIKARSSRNALDSTGRRIVAVDENALILWTTPQAEDMLQQAGYAKDPGQLISWEVGDWLAMENGAETFSLSDDKLTFKKVESKRGNEILLRLMDGKKGSDEDLLMMAFDLTYREAEVLLWITHGKSNKEIAEILDISHRTVNKHLEQIFVKLAIENRTAAATMAVRVLWAE